MNIPPPTDIEKILPREVEYADDVDFISFELIQTQEVQKTLEHHKLLVYVEIIDFNTLSTDQKKAKRNKESQITHSVIGDKEDIERGKQLYTAA